MWHSSRTQILFSNAFQQCYRGAVHDSWLIQYANDRAGEVLGVEDADSLAGVDFWSHFAPRSSGKQPPALAYANQVTRGVDFETDVRTFTSEGRKIWLSCSFRSGSQSRVSALLLHVWLMLARLPHGFVCIFLQYATLHPCTNLHLRVPDRPASHVYERATTSVFVCSLPQPCHMFLNLCTAASLQLCEFAGGQ
jgi:hypothetical protein